VQVLGQTSLRSANREFVWLVNMAGVDGARVIGVALTELSTSALSV
jgi:hypothetical protein